MWAVPIVTVLALGLAVADVPARHTSPHRRAEGQFTRHLLADWVQVSRRGPSTGLRYERTAESAFRRTERLRVAVLRLAPGGEATARLLGFDGKALAVGVSVSHHTDPELGEMVVAAVTLAPLAQGEYELELSLEKGGKKETTNFRFAVVP